MEKIWLLDISSINQFFHYFSALYDLKNYKYM